MLHMSQVKSTEGANYISLTGRAGGRTHARAHTHDSTVATHTQECTYGIQKLLLVCTYKNTQGWLLLLFLSLFPIKTSMHTHHTYCV